MATYVDSGMLEQQASTEEIHDLMLSKAHELYNLCDTENKGFITKRDMQRLQNELPLSPAQLEDVFDSLDDDGNGFLTLEEFTEGFGGFIGLGPSGVEKQMSIESSSSLGQEHVYELEGGEPEDSEEHFQEMLDTIGAHTVLEDTETLKTVWTRLRGEEPELLNQFETFLSRVTGELRRTHQEHKSLESALRTKSSTHDDEVRKLYEEMENQIKAEKERVLSEERARDRAMREELEKELSAKDKQLQEIMNRHMDMQHKLENLNTVEVDSKQETEKLLKEKMDLEDMLIQSQRNLDDSKSYITQLRQQYRSEKKERAMSALQISEGIALERESLVKQLEMLRDMNKRLRDERDEVDLSRNAGSLQNELSEFMMNGSLQPSLSQSQKNSQDAEGQNDATSPDVTDGSTSTEFTAQQSSQQQQQQQQQQRQMSRAESLKKKTGASLQKQGSILSNYFDEPRNGPQYESDDDIECDDSDLPVSQSAIGSELARISESGVMQSEYFPATERVGIGGVGYASANGSAPGASMMTVTDQSQREQLSSLPRGQHAGRQKAGTVQGQDGLTTGDSGLRGSNVPVSGTSASGTMSKAPGRGVTAAHESSLSQREYMHASHQGQIPADDDTENLSLAAELAMSQYTEYLQGGDSSTREGEPVLQRGSSLEFDIQSPRGAPVGANSSNESPDYEFTQKLPRNSMGSQKPLYASVATNTILASLKELESASPERLFKVVFVGDSGVGKSSFIHQFCSRMFKATFSATIGVDFQVKNLKVDGRIIALQLWDTAGQERFRSITKQYFRKADGVLIMYDVTSETSYKNVRNWMISVQDGTEENTVLAIVGNKMDLVDEEERRVVTTKDGSRLADEYGALFYETSAKSGLNVAETLQGMASLLREREDEELEKSLSLTDPSVKEKKCCG